MVQSWAGGRTITIFVVSHGATFRSVWTHKEGLQMLVLSRRVNESIHIGDDVVVTIVRFKDGGVRIGITAPPEITVMRSELVTSKKGKAE